MDGKSLGQKIWKCVPIKAKESSPRRRDLATSLENRIQSCIINAGHENFFDIEETFQLLCGERLGDDHASILEGDFEMYGATSFQQFFKEVCNLKHIKSLCDQRFDE